MKKSKVYNCDLSQLSHTKPPQSAGVFVLSRNRAGFNQSHTE